jgi:pyrimidine dimer DNA glycosylase
MRLWTLHPKYLDPGGLVALWREGLLAQAVLSGKTTGYVHHPQLSRFRDRPSAVGLIAEYLRAVHAESVERGYSFDAAKISRASDRERVAVARGQLEFEWGHLMAKLEQRDRGWRARLERVKRPQAHPVFRIVPGGIESWEKVAG